jgi:asparagine synthase (glutamine-hydrolysing)
MCGIAGYLRLKRARAIARTSNADAGGDPPARAGRRANGVCRRRVLAHKLCHHRPAARRPAVCNEDATLWTVFNGGSTTTSRARRARALGHRFKTRSDTEVLVHGYEQWGARQLAQDCKHLCLAIYDVVRRRLAGA